MDVLELLLQSQHRDSRDIFSSKIVFYGKEFSDDNIFFTALIGYTLHSLHDSFSTKEREQIQKIHQKNLRAFSFFENKHGGSTYNFYPTKPVNQYSGIPFLNKFTALHIPDDVDSTSLIYLAKTSTTIDSLKAIKSKLESLSYDEKPLKSIPKKHKETKAYRTWFATKMNHDMDICVMCNALVFTYTYQLPLSKVDNDSIAFIASLIKENTLTKHAYLYAPHYKSKAIVLYHIARLLSVTKHSTLLAVKSKITHLIEELLSKNHSPMEAVILYSSLYKLGQQPEFHITLQTKEIEQFYWFKANPFSIAKPWIKHIFSRHNFLHLEYKCFAYNLTLLLELQQLSKQKILKTSNEHLVISTF